MNTYTLKDLHIGLRTEFSVTLTETMLEQFLQLSDDRNPLHIDAAYARQHGFKDRVVYGLLTSSFYSKLVGVYLPGKHALLHGIEVAFHKPAFVGDSLKVEGEVIYLSEELQRIEVKAQISNTTGEILSKAKIKVGLHV